MKTFLLFIVGGGILGAAEWGEQGAVFGAAGGFCFWVLTRIIKFVNRHTDKIAEQFDDED